MNNVAEFSYAAHQRNCIRSADDSVHQQRAGYAQYAGLRRVGTGNPEAGQFWHDTTNNLIKLRSLDNTTWIPFLQLNEGSYAALPYLTTPLTGNRIINGAMDVDQVNEGASYAVTNATTTYAADQWGIILLSAGASGITAQRVADAPAGFVNSLKITVGTGATVGSLENLQIRQPFEGQNLSDLGYGTANAVVTSLSFWVKSSVTGTYSVLLENATGARTYITTFTIASAGVWQQVKIANIAGDQSGTWPSNNTQGLNISIVLSSGTGTQTSTLNAWQNGAFIAANTQSNGVLSTSGATFQLTGVMFNAGTFCLPYEKRSIQQELSLCERYFFKTFPQGVSVAQNAGVAGSISALQGVGASTANQASNEARFRSAMRVTPTVTTYNPSAANAQFHNQTRAADASSISANVQSANGWSFVYTTSAGSSSGDLNIIHLTASARM